MTYENENTDRLADFRFFELTDHIKVGQHWKKVPGGAMKLAVKLVHDRPTELCSTKLLTKLTQIRDALWDENGRIYLVKTHRANMASLENAGAKWDERGVFIERKGKIFLDMLQSYLPTMAHSPMCGEFVPATSWVSMVTQPDGFRRRFDHVA